MAKSGWPDWGSDDFYERARESKYTWFHSNYGQRLHFVVMADKEGEFWSEAVEFGGKGGLAACKLRTIWYAPGFISRIGMPRCAYCSDCVGIPRGGYGTPLNDDELRMGVKASG